MDKRKLFIIGAEEKAGYVGPHRLDAHTEFITARLDTDDSAILNVNQAYARVPWVKRAVKLRANAVSHVPFALMKGNADITESEEYIALVESMRELLYLTEMSICKQGKAYWLLESNQVGKNVTPRFIPAKSVENIKDKITGELKGFKINREPFPREEVVYFKEPSDVDEVEPGVSDVHTALDSAGLLYAISRMGIKLFRSGLMKITLIGLPFATPDDEIDRVEGFFSRVASGVRSWAKAIGMRKPSGGGDLDVTTIGHTPEEAQSVEMTESNRQDIAIALGMSPNIIDGKSANFATADKDWFGFYITTVIPQAERHAETINKDFLKPLGLELVFQFERMEIMQAAQLSQAEATRRLIGDLTAPIITREEAREIVGFEGDISAEDLEKLITHERQFKAEPQDPPDARMRSEREREMERELESYFQKQGDRVIEEVRNNGQ